ncbi:Serine protease family S33, partial [Phytophthora palmivora]
MDPSYKTITGTPHSLEEQAKLLDQREPSRVQWNTCQSDADRVKDLPQATRDKLLPVEHRKLEYLMIDLHSKLEGAVNVYTMDHRGSGRSTMLFTLRPRVIIPSLHSLEPRLGPRSLVELAPGVTGYVLDSVDTSSGGSKFLYMSEFDTNIGEVADQFLELCSSDKLCNVHFKAAVFRIWLEKLIRELDKNPKSTFAAMVHTVNNNEPNVS